MSPDPLPSLAPEALLKRHYRWMRAGMALCVASAGLLLTLAAIWIAHPSLEPWKNWGSLAVGWLAGLALSAFAATALWLLRRWSLRETAQRVDARLQSMNRLETAAQFSQVNDPIARAQRAETAAFLSRTPVHRRLRRFPWLVLALLLLLLGHATTWLAWTRPWVHPAVAAATPQASPTPAPLPEASIRWESPKAETKAAPIEEVPLQATAESTGGMRDLSLEISVNGDPKPGTPIPMAELAKPGSRKIETSMYFDQLNVQPYDMVSYYLRARRITGQPNVPETVSPVQFVQVKPFRDDIREENGSGSGLTQEQQSVLRLIQAMKVAQLRLIKENFTLAHAEITHDQPDWQQENKRVGGEQGILGTKAGQVLKAMIQAGAPANMVDLITQAKPLIGDAATKIVAEQNEPALPVQGKALASITAIEKYLIHIASQGHGSGKPEPPPIADPFAKQRDVILKQRAQTQAGELELLAQEQARLAEDLAKNLIKSDAPQPGATPDKNRITGTPGERQTQISQRVGALLNGQDFDPETTGHLEKGRDQAQESLRQLDAQDPDKAREPAATAAQEIQLAVDAMNKAGDEKAQQQMAAALRALNQAADQARSAPTQGSDQQARDAAQKAAQQAAQTRNDLADAAQQQQATGSQTAAAQMAALANALNDQKLREQLQKLHDQPRDPATAETAARHLDDLASRMVPQPGPGGPTREQLTALIERMERAQVNLARLAQQAGPPQPGQMGQQSGQPGPTAQPQSQGGSRPAGSPGTLGPTGPLGPLGESAPAPERAGAAPTGSATDGDRGQFTRALVEEVAEDTDVSSTYLPNSQTIMDAHANVRAVRAKFRQQTAGPSVVEAFGRLNEPLGAIINLLRVQLRQSSRQHELTDQQVEQAPPAYRAAVADYFERLSRDYQTAPEAPAPK